MISTWYPLTLTLAPIFTPSKIKVTGSCASCGVSVVRFVKVQVRVDQTWLCDRKLFSKYGSSITPFACRDVMMSPGTVAGRGVSRDGVIGEVWPCVGSHDQLFDVDVIFVLLADFR